MNKVQIVGVSLACLLVSLLAAACTRVSSDTSDSGVTRPVTLNFASPSSPRATLNSQVFEPWLATVMEESEGTLNVRRFYASPLGNYSNMYDRVNDGVVHIAFTTLAPIGGKFLQTGVASLPFEVETSLEGSIALWSLYEAGIISDEFDDIKLLGLFMFPNSALHMNDRPIEKLEDFNGVKLRTAGKMQSDTLSLLGGSPVTAPIANIYPGIERGVFDGAIIPWTGVAPFKLNEVTHYHTNAPLGSSVAMVFMNKDAFDNLPAAAQTAIENNTGLSLSKWTGSHSDKDASRTEQRLRTTEGQTVYDLPAAEAERWKHTLQPIIDDWVKKTPEGAEILAAFRAQISEVRAQLKAEHMQTSEQEGQP